MSSRIFLNRLKLMEKKQNDDCDVGVKMKWRKLGLIFCPKGNNDWMVSHASNPVVEPLGDSLYRVYFSTRDRDNRSSIGFIEFDIKKPKQILRIAERPLVRPGEPGLFDDSGASIGCLVTVDGIRYLYYTGWCLSVTVPWRNSIGLAINEGKELIFRKFSRAPLLDRSEIDPFSLSYPWVVRDHFMWKMWYGSNLSWGTEHPDMKHVIKYAESSDGIRWERKNDIAIPLQPPDEWGVSKPCVIRDGNIYKMWYSSRRSQTYRIGYAESADGINWRRKDDEVGIDVSESGWDSEMIEYSCIFDHDGKRYMLYNGNGYGKTGFGLAMLEAGSADLQ